MAMRRSRMSALGTVAAAIAMQGCAALPLAVVAGSLMDAGGGVLVKTGTEYTASGMARRTFNLPDEQVHAALLETFRRAQIAVERDDASSKGRRIVGKAQGRTVRVRMVALTPVLTAMDLDVKRNLFASDKATASELLAETEQILGESTAVATLEPDAPPRHVQSAHAGRPPR
jgi:hypothetical protein